MNKFKEILPYIIVIIAVILIRQFVITPIQVVGTSMKPNLIDGELMLLNKINYKFNEIKRFDIVVVDYKDEALVKRVIGLPGEKVKYQDGKLYINDELVKENFKTNGETEDYNITQTGYTTIPEDMYFIVGDNRINSADSRIIGLIDRDIILGKANFVLFPFSKFGNVK